MSAIFHKPHKNKINYNILDIKYAYFIKVGKRAMKHLRIDSREGKYIF